MLGTSNSSDAIRLAADRLQGESTGQFRRRRAARAGDADKSLVCSAVDRARDGDPDALRFLYLRYSDMVFSYVCSIVSDEHSAEDITQFVFSRLAMRLQRYKSGEVPFAGWIARVAYNASIDHLRAQRTVPCEEVRDPDVSREDVAPERREALRQALATLPADQRSVVVLRFVLGMSADEIGKRLGRSEPAVHALQHKGRRRMREELVCLEAAPTGACFGVVLQLRSMVPLDNTRHAIGDCSAPSCRQTVAAPPASSRSDRPGARRPPPRWRPARTRGARRARCTCATLASPPRSNSTWENRRANDTYGSALEAQPGESQGRPSTNAGSKPIER